MVWCVRVPREDGEATRQRLVAAGLLDHTYEITHVNDTLYLPITNTDQVPPDLDVVEYDVPNRDTETMPADILGEHPSYERLGDIVIIDENDPEDADEIAASIMDSDLDAKTVLNRASPIQGAQRVRDWTILAGNGTETVHREFGYEYELDLSSVYFSPRLATERHRVTQQITEGEQVIDMFCGVGPFVIPAADRGATVVGVDINADAIRYLERNADRNNVSESVTAIHGDVREIVEEYRGWADRLVLNLPHSAHEYLETAIALAGDECLVHYYDIQPDTDPFGPGEQAIRDGASGYDVSVVGTRVVRSYAPHEENVCLDVRLRRG